MKGTNLHWLDEHLQRTAKSCRLLMFRYVSHIGGTGKTLFDAFEEVLHRIEMCDSLERVDEKVQEVYDAIEGLAKSAAARDVRNVSHECAVAVMIAMKTSSSFEVIGYASLWSRLTEALETGRVVVRAAFGRG